MSSESFVSLSFHNLHIIFVIFFFFFNCCFNLLFMFILHNHNSQNIAKSCSNVNRIVKRIRKRNMDVILLFVIGQFLKCDSFSFAQWFHWNRKFTKTHLVILILGLPILLPFWRQRRSIFVSILMSSIVTIGGHYSHNDGKLFYRTVNLNV